jgi:hypothetical protein
MITTYTIPDLLQFSETLGFYTKYCNTQQSVTPCIAYGIAVCGVRCSVL